MSGFSNPIDMPIQLVEKVQEYMNRAKLDGTEVPAFVECWNFMQTLRNCKLLIPLPEAQQPAAPSPAAPPVASPEEPPKLVN